MNRAMAWFANNPVAANLMMLVILIGGAIAAFAFILLDRQYNFNIDKLFSKFKPKSSFGDRNEFQFKNTFRRPFANKDQDVQDAKYYEINSNSRQQDKVDQDEIDRILDKISQSGYQNLTDKEKRILFEASKKS